MCRNLNKLNNKYIYQNRINSHDRNQSLKIFKTKNLSLGVLVFIVVSLCIRSTQAEASLSSVIISQSVGQVGGYIITSREVQIAAIVEKFIYFEKDKKEVKFEINSPQLPADPLKDPNFLKELNSYLLDQVVSLESENFSITNVSNEDVLALQNRLKDKVNQNSYWKSLEVSDLELQKIIKAKLVSKDFISFKMSSVVSVVTDQEALAYYEKNRAKFGNGNFDSFKSTIKNFLSQQQMEERLKSWFELIKRKYKVRNLLIENQNQK